MSVLVFVLIKAAGAQNVLLVELRVYSYDMWVYNYNLTKIYLPHTFRGLWRTLSNIYDKAFCKNNLRLKVVYNFHKKASSLIFEMVLNTSLGLLNYFQIINNE